MIRDTFSGQVKEELARIWPEDDGALAWELAGLCLGCGRPLPGGGWRWRTESAATARLIVRLVRARYGVSPRLAVDRRRRLGRGNVYELWLDAAPAGAPAAGTGTQPPAGAEEPAGRGAGRRPGLLPGLPDPSRGQRPRRPRDREAFLRGLFLGAGSVTGPEHGYHAELVVGEPALQVLVAGEMQRWRLRPGRARRRGRFGLYLKEAEQIAELLGRLGAHQAVLSLENHRVVKGMRNQVNRLVNAETANLRKAVDAGLRQVEDIRRLVERVGWEGLPPSLRAVARARIEHPDLSLRELGQLLDPPLSKSAVGHRIRRLQALAARYREQ